MSTDICPKCGSEDVGGQSVEVTEHGATQDCYCVYCNHQWTLHFVLVPEPTQAVKRCPLCNGTNVEELLVCWANPNTGERGDEGLAELYPDVYWCKDCQKHPKILKEGKPATG
jgi:NAD-dependent SIR2 family protein deacetylase